MMNSKPKQRLWEGLTLVLIFSKLLHLIHELVIASCRVDSEEVLATIYKIDSQWKFAM